MARNSARVVRVVAPVVLQFGNGFRLRIEPESPGSAGSPGRRGRKPSPATQALIDALQKDREGGGPRTRADYLEVLRRAGHKGSPQSASIILTREAKRIFGSSLGRATRGAKGRRGRKGGRRAAGTSRGRPASPATAALRDKLQKDKSDGHLQDAAHYVRWLVDREGLGIRQARPIVYRELRAVR